MADDKQKGNVTPDKPKKVYLKDIAANLGMSPRVFRNAGYMANYTNIIKQKLQSRPDLLEQLDMAIAYSSNKTKKQGISLEEYKAMSEITDEELFVIIESFKGAAGNYKSILQSKILDHKISVTAKISASTNNFLKLMAEKQGISKSKLVSDVLEAYYLTTVLRIIQSDEEE